MKAAATTKPLHFERFSAEQGLSQSIVECIHLDRRGFLWLGTEDGLNRFDGYELKVFRYAADDPTSLSYSAVKCLLEDRSGALWVGTFGGLNRFDPASETCRRFLHRQDDPRTPANNVVKALLEDRSGSLWIGTQGGGLDRLEPSRDPSQPDRFHHHRHDPDDPGSLSHDDVRALFEDEGGRLWVGTAGGGLDCREPGGGRFRHYRHDPADPGSLSHDEVTVIHQDRRGRLWIGTRGGLNRLDPQAGCFAHYRAGPGGLVHDVVTALCEDDEGRLRIGTDGGGVAELDPGEGVVRHHRHDPREPTSLSTDRVFCCCLDSSGQLWVGTYGGGLNKADPRQVRFLHYRCHPDDPQSLSHGIVWSIWEDRDAVLWIGTDAGLDRIDHAETAEGQITHFRPHPDDPQALGHPGVRVVYEGPSGTLWVGTNGGLHRLDRETGRFERFVHDPHDPGSLSHDEIRALYEDASGLLWIATQGGGLNRFDPGTGTFTAFRHDPVRAAAGDPRSLGSDFVRCIYEDRHGRFWIGTHGGGLDRLDPATGHCVNFRHDPEDPGTLSSDHVFAIWEDAEGILWLGTYAGGLDRFDPRTGRVRRYGEAHGLPANLIYGVLGDEDGNFWLSSTKGLSRFNPRTERFRTWDSRDGLQSDEFNGGSCHRSRSGRLFFGGINGFNAFFPADLENSPFEPPVALTDFQLSGRTLRPGEAVAGRVPLARSIAGAREIRLSYRDRVFSFQFTSLDFTNPRKNRYAYRMVGFDPTWQYTDASRRFATYTNLPPGKYRFEVRGTNCDGVWSRRRASIRVVITPPVWGTWWFRGLAAATAVGFAIRSYHSRVRTIRLQTELAAAQDAQRSIWPQGDPHLEGFEIAAASLPASEVGGDFFDFVWLDPEREKLCIAIGDVAGKGMHAAMTAVMASGMMVSKVEEGGSLEEALRSVNRLVFRKASGAGLPAKEFTALCLASLEALTRELRYVNAGMTEPLLKSRDGVRFLATPDPRLPLGIHEQEAYLEVRRRLAAGDVLVLYTDGVPEAQSPERDVYGYDALKRWLATLPTERMSARKILRALVAEVGRFAAGFPQQDDMTIIVVKAGADGGE
ncbi:MAG: SpoIIE family protein phosphatase [bacterium]|nr:SpoIIE family protein phosphatase [bacterium]